MPYAETEEGEIFVLLGKEKEDRSWQPTSNKWCDFGGGRCYNQDLDCHYSAAREFMEEMAGCFARGPDPEDQADPEWQKARDLYEEHQKKGWTEMMKTLPGPMKLETHGEFDGAVSKQAASLKTGRYALLVARPLEGPSEETRRGFATFACKVPFDPKLPELFERVSRQLQKLSDCARLYSVEFACFFGKPYKKPIFSEMKLRVPSEDGTVKTIGCNPYVPRLSWSLVCRGLPCSVPTWSSEAHPLGSCGRCQACLDKTIVRVFKVREGQFRVYLTRRPPCSNSLLGPGTQALGPACDPGEKELASRPQDYVRLDLCLGGPSKHRLEVMDSLTLRRERLNRCLGSLGPKMGNHPAVRALLDPRMPQGLDASFVSVRPEFLEKQKILWWSLDRLKEVCQASNSSFKTEQFRQWMVDALSLFVDLLALKNRAS